jgi:hypothetical protein
MIKLPPKNRNQAIYWNRLCLQFTKPVKRAKLTKQELHRQNLVTSRSFLLDCVEIDGVLNIIQEIDRILNLKIVTDKHLVKISSSIKSVYEKYFNQVLPAS